MAIANRWRDRVAARLFMLAAGGLIAATLAPRSAAGNGWTEKVLYSFCSQSNCADGAGPDAGLIMDAAGNLYGTTGGGGAGRGGAVFELMPIGSGWMEK